MLSQHIPIISKLLFAFRTTKAFKRNNDVAKLMDWEQVKLERLSASDTAKTLLTIAILPASLAAAILLKVEYYNEFKQAFVNTRHVLMTTFLPFLIFMSAFFSARLSTRKDLRGDDIIRHRTNYALLLSSQKLFWPTLGANLGLVFIFFIGPQSSAPSEQLFVLYIVFLMASVIFICWLIIVSFYIFYYQIPKKSFAEDNREEGSRKYLSYSLKYLLITFIATVVVQSVILGASAAWAAIITA